MEDSFVPEYSATTNLDIASSTRSGSVNGYSNSGTVIFYPSSWGPDIFDSVASSENVNYANGDSIDVKSEVANAKPNSEYISFGKGDSLSTDFPNNLNIHQDYSIYQNVLGNIWKLIPATAIPIDSTGKLTSKIILISDAPQGKGKFEFKTSGSLSAKV